MAGRAAEIHQFAEAAQVESRHHGGRSHHAEAVHPERELAHRLLGPEERAEDRAVESKSLLPTRSSLADRVVEMGPHGVQRLVGVADIPAQRVRSCRCGGRRRRRRALE